jgi:signal peptidase I
MSAATPLTSKGKEDLKLSLVVEALRAYGMVRLQARGVSMLPALWPGDLLAIQSATPNDVIPGDIVLVLRGNQCFIHRLVRKQAGENRFGFITRGDAMPDNDPPVATAELLGRVVEVCRDSRSFVPSRRVSFVRSAMAWMLCRFGHFRCLALRLHAVRAQRWRRVGRTPSGALIRTCGIPGISAPHRS